MPLIVKDYFAGCETMDETKARYRELAQANHPDKFPDPIDKAQQHDIMEVIVTSYKMHVAFIEGSLNPGDDEEKSRLVFKLTLQAVRRFYFMKAQKSTGIKRDACKFATFYIHDYERPSEFGQARFNVELAHPTVKKFMESEEGKYTIEKNHFTVDQKLGFGILKHPLDEEDIKSLKKYLPTLEKKGGVAIPNGALQIVIQGNFENWTVKVGIEREDKTWLTRIFPEKVQKKIENQNSRNIALPSAE